MDPAGFHGVERIVGHDVGYESEKHKTKLTDNYPHVQRHIFCYLT